MSLTGQLSDLSLAELIEFFCNQRKTGRLKVDYKVPGYFYFLRGELVDAKIGSLSGVEAIYYALTQNNASFKFSAAIEPTKRTIHQPWASVALEGLRRLDEGIIPGEPVIDMETRDVDPDLTEENREKIKRDDAYEVPFSLTMDTVNRGETRSKAVVAGVAAAVLLSVAAIGVPAGWYKRGAAKVTTPAVAPQPVAQTPTETAPVTEASPAQPSSAGDIEAGSSLSPADAAAAAARRERELRSREQLRAQERNAQIQQPANQAPVAKSEPVKPAQKTVSVQVTYDESGRVTQTSGGDGMAQRIARQKRFPGGKAGTATISIPVN
jgi:hypothetical protein